MPNVLDKRAPVRSSILMGVNLFKTNQPIFHCDVIRLHLGKKTGGNEMGN